MRRLFRLLAVALAVLAAGFGTAAFAASSGPNGDGTSTVETSAASTTPTVKTLPKTEAGASDDGVDLHVSQSAAPNPVEAGAELTYTVTITNEGSSNTVAELHEAILGEVAFVRGDEGCTLVSRLPEGPVPGLICVPIPVGANGEAVVHFTVEPANPGPLPAVAYVAPLDQVERDTASSAAPLHVNVVPAQTETFQLGADPSALLVGEKTTLAARLLVDGKPVVEKQIAFTAVQGPNKGELGQAYTDSTGMATLEYSSEQTGTDTIEASYIDATQNPVTSNQATVTWSAPAPDVASLFVKAPETVVAGKAFDVTVSARDKDGAIVPGYTGTVQLGDGEKYAFTESDKGTHTFTGLVLTSAGLQTIVANDTENTSIKGETQVTVTAGSPSTLEILDGDHQSAPAGGAVAVRPSVIVKDSYGNPVAGVAITFEVAAGGGSVDGASQTTNGDGTAAVGAWRLGTEPGLDNNKLEARANFDVSAVVFTASVTAANAASLDLLGPEGARAGTPFTVRVTARDSFGSVATGYRGTIFFAGSQGSELPPPTYTFTAADAGTHDFTITYTRSGERTVSISDPFAGLADSVSFLVDPGPATHLDLSGPTSATAGQAFGLHVAMTDDFGNGATGYRGTITFGGGADGELLPADYTFTPLDNGAHDFVATLHKAGNRTITASDSSVPALTDAASLTVQAATARVVAQNDGDEQTALVGTAVETPPSVVVADAFGNPVAGVAVDFVVTGGNGSVTGAHQTTDNTGIARVGSWTLGDEPGSNTLTATAADLAGSPVEFVAQARAGDAAELRLEAPDTAIAGEEITVTLTALDELGNVAAGYRGTVHFSGGGDGAHLPGDYTFTADDAGTQTFTAVLTKAGAQTLHVGDGGLADDAPVAVGPAAPSSIEAATDEHPSATVGTKVEPPPAVLVTDRFGNPTPGIGIVFRVTGGGGSVTGDEPTTNGAGVATVGSWTLGTTAGDNALEAGVPGNQITPFTFHAAGTAGTATHLVLQLAGEAVTAGEPFDVRVTAQDEFGNVAGGYRGTVQFSGGGPDAGLPADYTFGPNDNGTHEFVVTLRRAGNHTLTVEDDDNDELHAEAAITVRPAVAQKLTKLAGDNQSATAGTPVATAPSAIVTDAFDNPVAGVQVTFAATAGGGSVTGASQTSSADGVVTVGSWTLGPGAGSNNNTLTATGAGTQTTFTASGTAVPQAPSAGTNASLRVAVAAPQSARTNESFTATITVSNSGPDASTGVVVRVPVPTGAALDSAPASCDRGATVVCHAGTLGVGGSAAFDLSFTASQQGQITVSASAEGAGSGSSTSSATTTILLPTALPLPPPAPTTPGTFNAIGTGTIIVNGVARSADEIFVLNSGDVVDVTNGTITFTAVDGSYASFAATQFTARRTAGRRSATATGDVPAQFRVTQAGTAIPELTLVGGDFSVCTKPRSLAATNQTPVRQLWGSAKGKFTTRARFSAATVRGTIWLTQDRCDGSLVQVVEGIVDVIDVTLRKTVAVSAGQSYVAKPKSAAKKPPKQKKAAKKTAKPKAAGSATYTTRAGDTLYGIAAAKLGKGSRWQEIARLNRLAPPYSIPPGTKLRLPRR